MFKILNPFHIYAPTPLIINKINKLSESYLLKKPKSIYINSNNIISINNTLAFSISYQTSLNK